MKRKTFVRMLAALLAAAVSVAALAACTGKPFAPDTAGPESSAPDTEPADTRVHLKIGTLSGPTGMGMATLFTDEFYGDDIELYTAPDAVRADLISGKLDIAAVPANLAAVIYNKTEGDYLIAAVNTLGVLYIVTRDENVNALSDLDGKKLYATGQASTPEYILNNVLSAAGVAPSETEYKTEHSELASLLLAGTVDTAMLPQPFVTTVLSKDSSLRIAADLSEEWKTRCDGDAIQGVLVVSKKAAEENKASVDAFLNAYRSSVDFVNANTEEAGALIADAGIVASAELAAAAIPGCHIVYIEGQDMKSSLTGFLDALYRADPSSVGGKLPDDGIWYVR